jgi:DNA-binding LacI/PurR family transcriptional regulator
MMPQRQSAGRRPTQADVSRLAGVSVAVVSAVVNNAVGGKIRVGKEAEARVRDAIAKLGYVPNLAARQLAGGRNNVVGVFAYTPIFPTAADDYYYPMLAGIEESAAEAGQNLLLYTGGVVAARGTRSIYDNGSNRLLLSDGSILLGRDADANEIRRLIDEGYPFVYIGRRSDDLPVSYVTANYAHAVEDAVDRSVALGHRRHALIASDIRYPAMADRAGGFVAARAAHGLEVADVYSVPSEEPVDELVTRLIETGITCIYVADTLVARSAIAVIESRGLAVPRDVSVVSLSDYPGGSDPELSSITSVETPTFAMGQAALEVLMEVLDTAAAERTPLSVEVTCGFRDGRTLARALG